MSDRSKNEIAEAIMNEFLLANLVLELVEKRVQSGLDVEIHTVKRYQYSGRLFVLTSVKMLKEELHRHFPDYQVEDVLNGAESAIFTFGQLRILATIYRFMSYVFYEDAWPEHFKKDMRLCMSDDEFGWENVKSCVQRMKRTDEMHRIMKTAPNISDEKDIGFPGGWID